jgi:hypothetical protein
VTRLLPLLSVLSLIATTLAADTGAAPERERLHIGVSDASFGAVNRNDASAALKAWAATVARERNLQVEIQVDIFDVGEASGRALGPRHLHAVSLTCEEFFRLGMTPGHVYVPNKDGRIAQHYVLIVRRDGGVESLDALRGRKLMRHASHGTSPALPWLDLLLAEAGLGRPDEHFAEVAALESPSKTVLRVFFGQSDAGLVGATTFETACELNPQLRRKLQVIAVSPPLVPGVFFFLDDYTSPQRREFEEAIVNLHTSIAGQQVLTVFASTTMERVPLSTLDVTRELFARCAQLRAPVKGAPDGDAPSGTVNRP